MTKDEALAQIRIIRTSCDDLNVSQEKISEVLDQIDQPPGEFSVRELIESLGTGHYVHLYANGCWFLASRINCDGEGIDALRAKLLELAKPPEPKTIMVEMPLAVARCCAERLDGDIKLACKAALEKAKL